MASRLERSGPYRGFWIRGPYVRKWKNRPDKRLYIIVRLDTYMHKEVSYPRYLMEVKLNRKLETYEVVHHIDEDPMNNDLSNLEVVYDDIHTSEHCGKRFRRKNENSS